jgi:hypothetical protein
MSGPHDPLHPERDLESLRQGELFKADGMRRAEAHAPVSWRGWAELAVRHVAERRERFTTDPVWTLLRSWNIPLPPEPRALGPLMQASITWGWCEPTGEYVKSVLPQNHRRPIAVYRSLLHARKAS